MVLVIIYMKVLPAKRQELSQTITSLLSPIRAEKGCGRCDFYYGMEDEYALCLLQEWETRKDLEAHNHSECFKVLRGAVSLLAEPCEIISCNSLRVVGN